MDQDGKYQPRPTPPSTSPASPADDRKARLAAALRDNLKRRKQQGKARRVDTPPESGKSRGES